jgi:hypothetical protein
MSQAQFFIAYFSMLRSMIVSQELKVRTLELIYVIEN